MLKIDALLISELLISDLFNKSVIDWQKIFSINLRQLSYLFSMKSEIYYIGTMKLVI